MHSSEVLLVRAYRLPAAAALAGIQGSFEDEKKERTIKPRGALVRPGGLHLLGQLNSLDGSGVALLRQAINLGHHRGNAVLDRHALFGS